MRRFVVSSLVCISLFFPSFAPAHEGQRCGLDLSCTQGEAFAAAQSEQAYAEHCASLFAGAYVEPGTFHYNFHSPTGKLYSSSANCMRPGDFRISVGQPENYRYGTVCADLPNKFPLSALVAGTLYCSSGCEYDTKQTEVTNIWSALEGVANGNTCDPDNRDCPAGYTEDGFGLKCVPPTPPPCPVNTERKTPSGPCEPRDDCPAGSQMGPHNTCVPTKNECPAGQIKGPDGSCISDPNNNNGCPAGQVKGPDGSCKPDTNNDGQPDPPDPNDPDKEGSGTFSGGDNCNSPPSCSGDAILCGSARIQWRIDCNTRHSTNVTGGSCASVPMCTGQNCDALEYAQLLQQWRSSCALEKLAGGSGDPTGEGQPEWTKADGMNQDPGLGSGAGDTDVWKPGDPIDGSALDQSGFVGGGGSCPAIPSAAGGTWGGQFLSDLPPAWCDYIAAIRLVLLALAMLTSLRILVKS